MKTKRKEKQKNINKAKPKSSQSTPYIKECDSKDQVIFEKEIDYNARTVVKNCDFNVESKIVWEAKAIESVQTVAKALLNLTELFKVQDIKVYGLTVHSDGVSVPGGKVESK